MGPPSLAHLDGAQKNTQEVQEAGWKTRRCDVSAAHYLLTRQEIRFWRGILLNKTGDSVLAWWGDSRPPNVLSRPQGLQRENLMLMGDRCFENARKIMETKTNNPYVC